MGLFDKIKNAFVEMQGLVASSKEHLKLSSFRFNLVEKSYTVWYHQLSPPIESTTTRLFELNTGDVENARVTAYRRIQEI